MLYTEIIPNHYSDSIALMLLSACETTEGLGRDTSKLGNNISNAAEKNAPK